MCAAVIRTDDVPEEIAYKIEKSALLQLKVWTDTGEAPVSVSGFKERLMAHFRTPIVSKQPGLGASNALKLKPAELTFVDTIAEDVLVAIATRGAERWVVAGGTISQPPREDEAVGEVDIGDDFASGGDY